MTVARRADPTAALHPVSPRRLDPGRPWPLGATWDGHGVNFAVFSAQAQALDLCVFDERGERELQRLALPALTDDVWHGYLPQAGPGLTYGLRAHGPWQPVSGLRFSPHKLLLDPWARELVGRFEWRGENFAFDPDHPDRPDLRDNAAHTLKARVVGDRFDWASDVPPRVPRAELRLLELHVKGFTAQHPQVPQRLRGTFAGLASEAALEHLRRLGINAVCLLPVHEHIDEQRLVARGLSNYWGYNTVGFFAPERRYAASGNARDEFRQMVRALHAAGIEVILDVVFNHTAETDHLGPTISWRGLDNAGWYRLDANDRSLYENHTGCGNTLDLRQPRVLQFVLDCLRYWVTEMHVDGFRFDLAPVLARGAQGFERNHPFFHAVAQDPVLAGVRLIAEPWDLGPGGYQLGQFPPGWLEWNDRFRDGARAFWLGGPSSRGEFAQRLCASSDVFQPTGRAPFCSVNYVVSHDGFTLSDLVSYNQRHNLANGEDNLDGPGHNLSWNCGVEGPTSDPQVVQTRQRLKRALLATLLLAQGTPMLAAGDELGHSQGGNNNPYCQDNETSWIDWVNADQALTHFVSRMTALRAAWLPLEGHWYDGRTDGDGMADLQWFDVQGRPLDADAWRDPGQRAFGARIGRPGRARRPLLLLVNADETDRPFRLPPGTWRLAVDSAEGFVSKDNGPSVIGGALWTAPSRSLTLMTQEE
jgi:glycogen operon protein